MGLQDAVYTVLWLQLEYGDKFMAFRCSQFALETILGGKLRLQESSCVKQATDGPDFYYRYDQSLSGKEQVDFF